MAKKMEKEKYLIKLTIYGLKEIFSITINGMEKCILQIIILYVS